MALNWLNDLPGLSAIYDKTSGSKDTDWTGKHINARNIVKQLSDLNTDYDMFGTTTISGRPNQLDLMSGTNAKGGNDPTPPPELAKVTGDDGWITGDTNNNTLSAEQVAYNQMMAQRAADEAEARELRESILGRRDDIQSIRDAILANIDTELREAKSRRTGQFDRDVDSLVGALDAAIPDIQNAFAAMGLSNSTYKGDRVQDTRDSYGKSYEDTNRQLNEDLTGFQRNATSKKAKANTNADKMFGALDEVKGMEANAGSLDELKRFNSDTRNALADFKGEKAKFLPGGDELRAISKLDSDYDFGKTLDTFNAFASDKASPSGNGVGGSKSKVGQIYEDDKKKKKTEVQINNPVGAASA